MRVSFDANVQGFILLSDDLVRHTPIRVLRQKPHTAVLREGEVVETRTHLRVKGT